MSQSKESARWIGRRSRALGRSRAQQSCGGGGSMLQAVGGMGGFFFGRTRIIIMLSVGQRRINDSEEDYVWQEDRQRLKMGISSLERQRQRGRAGLGLTPSVGSRGEEHSYLYRMIHTVSKVYTNIQHTSIPCPFSRVIPRAKSEW